jgi:salicylate hydroxylase
MSENNLKVAIIGAGLGGLAVAIALHKQNINAQIYEKAQQLRLVGAGLSLFPNGLNTLEAIAPGIVETLKHAGSPTRMVNLRKNTGEIIMQNPQVLQEKYGQPMLQIRWSRLQEILASRLPPEVIHLNYRCIGFEQNDSGIEVCFDNGEKAQVDLLIGADGINSAIREILIKDGLPRYAGRMSWRAVIKYKHDLILPNEVTITTSPEGGKIFTLIDVGGGYIFWSAGALSADDSLSQNAVDVKSRVLDIFAGWEEPVEAIIKETDANQIVERPIWDRPPLQKWSQGRVTLLGDAAHPMTPALGQGANTAFEDAWELRECLMNAPNIETALANYESSRIHRTQVIQARSALQGSRAYDADNETFFRGVSEQAKASQTDFEDWLYNYKLS